MRLVIKYYGPCGAHTDSDDPFLPINSFPKNFTKIPKMLKICSAALTQLGIVASFAYLSNNSCEKTNQTLRSRLVNNKDQQFMMRREKKAFGEAAESLLVL